MDSSGATSQPVFDVAETPAGVGQDGAAGVDRGASAGVVGQLAGAQPVSPGAKVAVYGCASNWVDLGGIGVQGVSDTASGVVGESISGAGVTGRSAAGIGVFGAGGRAAGRFEGTVEVSGPLRVDSIAPMAAEALQVHKDLKVDGAITTPRLFGTSIDDTPVVGTSSNGTGVQGISTTGKGVHGTSTSGTGVHGTSTSGAGVVAESTNSVGIRAKSANSNAILAVSTDQTGVIGISTNGTAVRGQSSNNHGVHGMNTGPGTTGAGVLGQSTNGAGVRLRPGRSAERGRRRDHADDQRQAQRDRGHRPRSGRHG